MRAFCVASPSAAASCGRGARPKPTIYAVEAEHDPMLLIRPIRESDLPALVELAGAAGIGMTSLPGDVDLLRKKIELSLSSFAAPHDPAQPRETLFLFVAEDIRTGALAGTTAIKSGIGLSDPFYSYRLDKVVHASPQLSVHKVMPTLYLSNDYTGAAELASLLLVPAYRSGGNGHLLSKCRFLFLAEHAQRFPSTVIADMRGVSDSQGRSPFWEALGRHFFSMDFPLADRLSGSRSKAFIAELMPRHPIYVPLLPAEAQAVIGQVHDNTRPALKLLEAEGFRHKGYVDIFDAGPTLEAELGQVRAVADSRVGACELADLPAHTPVHLIATTAWDDFRCLLAPALWQDGRWMISAEHGSALGCASGDSLRGVVLKPSA